MKKIVKLRALVLTVFMMFAVIGVFSLTAAAESVVSVDVTGQYGQTEARKMLAMINEFRTGSDAWQWNSDNTTKTVYSAANGNALGTLTYDYNLERAAMLRAMETAIYWDHTRPNGTSCFTAYSGYNYYGENIAAGYGTAEAVFTGWQETNEDYSGQGHRRNMLDPGFTAVGIGHVYYNGCHYWVQEFGSPVKDTTVTAANDSSTAVGVEILPSQITEISAAPEKTTLTVTYGSSVALPGIITKIKTAAAWPGGFCTVSAPYTWSVADSSYASISSGSLSGSKVGTTNISATVLGTQVTVPVTVEPASIASASVTLAAASYTYDGAAKTPAVTGVKLNGRTLVSGTDYMVSYANNTNAGTATVTVTGKGNYTGTAVKNFTIQAANISGCTLSNVAAQAFTGMQIKPQISAVYAGKTLTAGTDYTVAYTNNVNAGTASITLTGKGNYTGTASKSFTINPVSFANCTVGNISAQAYTGAALTPVPSVSWNSKTLVSGTDYTVTYTKNTDVGTASVALTGKGNYSGSVTKNFTISPRNLSSCTVADIAGLTYTGAALTPGITVKYGSRTLVNNTDYTVSYANNTNVGTAVVTITGKTNFTGKVTKNFTIAAIDLGGALISTIADQTYTGAALTPAIKVAYASKTLKSGTEYTVSYTNNVNAGTATVTATGNGNYKGTASKTFKINPLGLDKCTVNQISSQTYTGSAIIPKITIVNGSRTLAASDFTVSCTNNINVGTASVTITGKGNYTGTVPKSFTINPANLANCTVGNISAQTYTGAALTPALSVAFNSKELISGTDYTVDASDNVNVGTATVTITGKGNYSGSVKKQFAIVKPAPSVTPGDSVEDSRTKASYRVTEGGSSSQMPTVEYVKPLNTKATSIVIPDTVTVNNVTCKVTSIAAKAFQNNKKLKKVKIGKNITTIGTKAFYGCTKLTSVTMGANVTDINAYAFAKCTSLTKITISGKVAKIGKQAFYGCKKLKTITIKTKKLTSKTVGSKAFKGIYNKATIKVPKSKLKAYKKVLKAKGIGSKVKVVK